MREETNEDTNLKRLTHASNTTYELVRSFGARDPVDPKSGFRNDPFFTGGIAGLLN